MTTGNDHQLHPELWVQKYGDYLFNYALLRLRDTSIAEEMVQETFLGALRSRPFFKGESTERTWLIGILKNKIVDHIRRTIREGHVSNVETSEKQPEEFFDIEGKWVLKPAQWISDPGSVIEKKEFWKVFQSCMAELPAQQAHAFTLREIEELSTDEICNVLNISSTNLRVIIYRARIRLRHCLESKWFSGDKKGTMMFMITCREASRLISESLDRRISFWERIILKFHLLMCKFCSRYKRQMLFTREVIQRYINEIEMKEGIVTASLSQDAKKRIHRAIELNI
jgi:RNA polymerase sigma-70 factor (ECF subfamily)